MKMFDFGEGQKMGKSSLPFDDDDFAD